MIISYLLFHNLSKFKVEKDDSLTVILNLKEFWIKTLKISFYYKTSSKI